MFASLLLSKLSVSNFKDASLQSPVTPFILLSRLDMDYLNRSQRAQGVLCLTADGVCSTYAGL
jgi:hypothetical protein